MEPIYSTRELIDILRSANPERALGEEDLRLAIRGGRIERPRCLGGRYIWRRDDVRAVAEHLGLAIPDDRTAATETVR